MARHEMRSAYDEVEVEDTLLLKNFQPVTVLKQEIHVPEKARFPAVDSHVHLDEKECSSAESYLKIMDEAGVEASVSVQLFKGRETFEYLKRFSIAHPGRFKVVMWVGLEDLEQTGRVDHFLDWMKRFKDLGVGGIKFWKDLGLTARDPEGNLWQIDDPRLDPVWDLAAKIDLPVIFHSTDPDAFFLPIDRFNERYEELIRHPDWSFADRTRFPEKREVLRQQETVISRHPDTRFWAAHCAARGENLAELSRMLATYPNFYCDTSARINELGRQPWTARDLIIRFADRIAFGSDLEPSVEMYRPCWRFFETRDEYWDYPSHPSRQGRWKVHSLWLPDQVLKKFYHDTAWNFYWKS